ncbi:DUF910 family protein [Latilactobacillus curvatus]|jgi:uncharacterized protein YqgQ|uniref:DUF910 domain-containing protein n=3 Tax=Latilactobacillus curvatus TaxID=28038 RepID=A0A0B2XJK2_LATCU|nr:DUF910 domain-containing protein [Latilactobacillus curvatus]EHE86694.1 hypothetical protein CRL705_191 [Latilactobacillus curvatus CRL 705]KRK93322.1 hypothetical protein FC08_GL001063 [Latilactobacillus curvatus JCM 1096 = DSM 20019]ASN62287.1 DUF910 domain-containing protein [Latilactobacillus curvatus]AWV72644.1 DUF910 family protein [Latilactobacillus curvatus]
MLKVKLMRTLYDVQQLLKQFGVYVHLGKRLWDIELTSIELRHVYDAGLIDGKVYRDAKMVLVREHRLEKNEAFNHNLLEEKFK